MGIPSEMRDYFAQTIRNNKNNTSFVIPSPAEDQRMLESKRCTEGSIFGFS